MRRSLLSVLAAAVIGLGAFSVDAAVVEPVPVSLVSVSGTWTAVATIPGKPAPTTSRSRRGVRSKGIVSRAVTGTTGLTGLNSSVIRWGTPLTRRGKSGYSFVGATQGKSGPIAVDQGMDFDLGTFSHLNHTIGNDTSITGATLTVAISLLIGDVTKNITAIYNFDHWETDNIPTTGKICADQGKVGKGVNVKGCADRVTVSENQASMTKFVIDNIEYTLSITGLLQGNTLFDKFWTREDALNSAVLRAHLTSRVLTTPPPSQVPLPAGAPLLAGGIAALALLRRRRQHA